MKDDRIPTLTLTLPLAWRDRRGDGDLHAGDAHVGSIYMVEPDSWNAYGCDIRFQHASRNHPTREAAQAALFDALIDVLRTVGTVREGAT